MPAHDLRRLLVAYARRSSRQLQRRCLSFALHTAIVGGSLGIGLLSSPFSACLIAQETSAPRWSPHRQPVLASAASSKSVGTTRPSPDTASPDAAPSGRSHAAPAPGSTSQNAAAQASRQSAADRWGPRHSLQNTSTHLSWRNPNQPAESTARPPQPVADTRAADVPRIIQRSSRKDVLNGTGPNVSRGDLRNPAAVQQAALQVVVDPFAELLNSADGRGKAARPLAPAPAAPRGQVIEHDFVNPFQGAAGAAQADSNAPPRQQPSKGAPADARIAAPRKKTDSTARGPVVLPAPETSRYIQAQEQDPFADLFPGTVPPGSPSAEAGEAPAAQPPAQFIEPGGVDQLKLPDPDRSSVFEDDLRSFGEPATAPANGDTGAGSPPLREPFAPADLPPPPNAQQPDTPTPTLAPEVTEPQLPPDTGSRMNMDSLRRPGTTQAEPSPADDLPPIPRFETEEGGADRNNVEPLSPFGERDFSDKGQAADNQHVPPSGGDLQLPPSATQMFNGRNCAEDAAACEAARKELASKSLAALSLDITPSIEPREVDMTKVNDLREAKVAKAPPRVWRNRTGAAIANGYLADYRNGLIYVRAEDGVVETIREQELSNEDWCFLTAWWEIPAECRFEDLVAPMRDWTMTTFTWTASALCHKPLYFEEPGIERYGHSAGPILQPVLSGAHFFGSVLLLPSKVGLNPPNECLYGLGYYRPGNCAPWLVPGYPLTTRSVRWQTLAIGAAVVLLP